MPGDILLRPYCGTLRRKHKPRLSNAGLQGLTLVHFPGQCHMCCVGSTGWRQYVMLQKRKVDECKFVPDSPSMITSLGGDTATKLSVLMRVNGRNLSDRETGAYTRSLFGST
jgi:hypothetical protein